MPTLLREAALLPSCKMAGPLPSAGPRIDCRDPRRRIPTSKGAVARFIQNSGEQVRAVIHKSAWQPNPSVLAKPASQQKRNRSSQSPCGRSFGGKIPLESPQGVRISTPSVGTACQRGDAENCRSALFQKSRRNVEIIASLMRWRGGRALTQERPRISTGSALPSRGFRRV